MKMLAIPVPIFNFQMGVEAYTFRYQKGENLFLSGHNFSAFDGAMDPPLLQLVNKIGIEALTLGKRIFVPISHISLLANLEEQCNENPDMVVFLLNKSVTQEDVYRERIARFKGFGYRFAFFAKGDISAYSNIISLCDYLVVDSRSTDVNHQRAAAKSLNRQIQIVVSGVDYADIFNKVRTEGFELFEGSIYRLPVTKGQNVVSPLKVNYIRLLNIVRMDNFDLDQVSKIIQQDTALAISLLQVVNSLGLGQKIRSINHAAAILGQNELRKWITTAVTKMLSADKPNEITKLSLVRAKFAENLAPRFEMAVNSESLFLMGLFSVIDIILDMPMEQALDIVRVSDSIRNALLFKQGKFYDVLEFITFYEAADWANVSRLLIVNSMHTEDIFNGYFDALTWYSNMVLGTDNEAQ